jgi:hypothetical protein
VLKDLLIAVEAFKTVGKLLKSVLHDNVLPHNVTEFKEGAKTLNYILRNMPLNCREIDFHECLQFIACPL